jgi:hypothetical protein
MCHTAACAPALQVIYLSTVTISLINKLVVCMALLFQSLPQLLHMETTLGGYRAAGMRYLHHAALLYGCTAQTDTAW